MDSVAIDSVVAQRVQNAAIRQGNLLIWTVYRRPLDFPDLYIARPHLIEPGQTEPMPFHLQAATLAELRKLLLFGLYRMDRQPGDEAQIAESWM
jgi:hypothetical protein